ncbi:MAG: hypothetical protein ACFB4J_11955 [Elainellaceae cyanobacterium]
MSKQRLLAALRRDLGRRALGVCLVGVALLGGCANLVSSPPKTEETQLSDNFDPFDEAVSKATEAVALGQTADTEAEWQTIAEMWQTAADLMRAVPPDHPNYEVAQQRAEEDYIENFQIAQNKAGTAGALEESTDDDKLTKVDFGQGWPFVVDGELRCESVSVSDRELKLVTLHSIGQVYAVNGPAQARASERGWRNVDEVWRSSPIGTGKAPINWVLMRAEADCSA